MWKLDTPNNDDRIDNLKIAFTYENGKVKYNLHDQEKQIIIEIYDQYETLLGQPAIHLQGKDKLTAQTLDALHDAYSEVQRNRRLESLRSRLLTATDRCPICSISVVDELDHYLPKSIYKPLAIYSSNLIPICHKCNNKKSKTTNEDPNKRFLHAYFNKTPTNNKFFKIKTEICNGKLDFDLKIIKTASMSDVMYNCIMFQVERVNLKSRLLDEINIFLGGLYTSFNMIFESSNADGLRKYLKYLVVDYEKRFGINDWRTALIDSLSDNNNFYNGGYKEVLGYS